MEPVNHCSHCGAAVDVNASVCPECGQELVKVSIARTAGNALMPTASSAPSVANRRGAAAG